MSVRAKCRASTSKFHTINAHCGARFNLLLGRRLSYRPIHSGGDSMASRAPQTSTRKGRNGNLFASAAWTAPRAAKSVVASTALSSVSVLALATVLLIGASQPARAADECGAEGAGADTVTCTGTSYANGITYAGSDGLSLVLNNAAMTVTRGAGTDGVNLSGTTANDLTVTAASLSSIDGGTGGSAIIVTNDGDGKAAVVLNGGTFTTDFFNQATIRALHNSGAGDSIITLNAGQVANTNPSTSFDLNAEIAGSATGNATILMTGGSVQMSTNVFS